MLMLLALLLSVEAASVKDCGTSNALFSISALSLSPTDPLPGDNVTLHLEYNVPPPNTINDGTVSYDITYNFIPFAPSSEPLCMNVPCPLSPGKYTNDTTSKWPTGLSGTIMSVMRWKDLSSRLLLCVQISGKV
jgi:hypothetical protein